MIPPYQRTAIIWDLDGTLVDTADAHFKTWKDTLNEEGIAFEKPDFDRTFGQNNFATLGAVLGYDPDLEFVKRIGGRKEERFREMIADYVKLTPGALNCLRRFFDLGFIQAIGSSAPMINIQKICEDKNITRYFSAIIAGDNLPPKPDPTVFEEAAKKLGKLPVDCLVIEDSRVGIRAAKAAGMRCLAVATTIPASQLTEADIIIPDLTKLDDGFIEKEIVRKN